VRFSRAKILVRGKRLPMAVFNKRYFVFVCIRNLQPASPMNLIRIPGFE